MAFGKMGARGGFGSFGVLGSARNIKPAVVLPVGSRIVATGDSFTAGLSGTIPAYPAWSYYRLAGRLYWPNQGMQAVPGTHLSDICGDSKISSVLSLNPDIVTIAGGTNWQNETPDQAWTLFKYAAKKYLDSGKVTWVVFVYLPPDNTAGAYDTFRQAFNALMEGFATDPELARYKNNCAATANLDSVWVIANDTQPPADLGHPTWSGCRKIGDSEFDVLTTLVASDVDILSTYQTNANLLFLNSKNPQFAGPNTPTGWAYGTQGGITSTPSTVTLNGASARRIVASGSSASASGFVRLLTSSAMTLNGLAGEFYEFIVDFSLAPGSQNLRTVYLSLGTDNVSYWNQNQVQIMDTALASTGVSGYIRTTIGPLTVDLASVTPVMGMSFPVGTVAGDVTFGRPYIRKITSNP